MEIVQTHQTLIKLQMPKLLVEVMIKASKITKILKVECT